MRAFSDEYVESRLEEWAEWFSRGNYSGLGYPSKTLEQRLKEGGGILVEMTGPWVPPSNRKAEEIEDLVKELAKQYPSLATVLRKKYFASSYKNLRNLAKDLGMPESTFRSHIAMAKVWLSAKLGHYIAANNFNIKKVV